jgi:hypothetical protein
VGFYLQYDPVGSGQQFAFYAYGADSTSGPYARAAAPFTPTINTWYHLTATYDSVAHQIRLYVNDILRDSQPFTSSWAAAGNTAIGRAKWNGGPVNYWPGKIDEGRAPGAVEMT